MNPVRWLAIRIGRQPWLPRYAKQIVGLDVLLQRLTRGRFNLLTMAGLPEVMLHRPRPQERRRARATPLLCVPHGDGWLVGGLQLGRPEDARVGRTTSPPPTRPRVLFTRHAPHRRRRARLHGDERAELWQVMLRTWPNYAKYAERTDREIPVFLLTPSLISDGSAGDADQQPAVDAAPSAAPGRGRSSRRRAGAGCRWRRGGRPCGRSSG